MDVGGEQVSCDDVQVVHVKEVDEVALPTLDSGYIETNIKTELLYIHGSQSSRYVLFENK